jgi:shikimate dehydrogenase
LPFDVEAKHLPRLMDELRACESYLGGSVTVPYKIAVVEHLDEVDSRAGLIGAVNTILRTSDGRLVGYNTDAKGGIDTLTRIQPGQSAPFLESLDGLDVLMIGAGGAGRAMAFYLAEAIGDGNLTIVNRTHERAEALAADVAEAYHNAQATPASELAQIAQEVALVVNCTTCGQSGLRALGDGQFITLEPYSSLAPAAPVAVEKGDGTPVLEAFSACVERSRDDIAENNRLSMELILKVRPEVCFFDIVYSPLETVMLRQARFAGHRTLSGKGMNIGQAAEAMFNIVCKAYFEERGLWTEETYNRILQAMYNVW